MPAKFQIKRAKNGEFHFNLLAGNGEVILSSELYKAKASAKNGIASVKKNSALDGRFEKRQSKNGQFFFVLKAANHEVIGKSEMYPAEKACDNGIVSVKKNAGGATVEDLTK
jgi:uncharacterized protein